VQTPQSISLVVPVYNEIENLEKLCSKISAAMNQVKPSFWEAVLVNDGSRDGSGEWLVKYCETNPNFRAVHFHTNQGQTAGFDAGFRAAKGDFIITMDADLQNDPADIPLLLAEMRDGIGAVCGVRVKRQDTWLRRISSRIANNVRNRISGDNITDTGCSLKLFRAICFERMPMFEGMHRFLPTLVKMEGYSVFEVHVSHHARYAGQSKYGVWNRIFRSFGDLIAVRWMKMRKLRYQPHDTPNPALSEANLHSKNSQHVGMSHT